MGEPIANDDRATADDNGSTMMELFQCEPFRLRLTRASCASQYQNSKRGDTSSTTHRRECVNCPVGKSHAAGEDSGTVLSQVEVKASAFKRKRYVAKTGPKPDRTCDQCQTVFSPLRWGQKFCPGGKCNTLFQRAKNRKGPARKTASKAAVAASPPPRTKGTKAKIYPTDQAHAHSVVMGAVEENPDLFSGLSAAALPVLARHVAGAIVRARDGRAE